MKKILIGLTAAAALAGASLASAHPVQAHTALSECTPHRSATAQLTSADASWLGKAIDCMYGSMLYQQVCGPHPTTSNGDCIMAGGYPSDDLVALAKRLLPKMIRARSGPQLSAIVSTDIHSLRLNECTGRYQLRWYADDSAGPQSTSPTLNAVASELRHNYFARGSTSGYFGAAGARGELATGGRGQSQVSYLVVSVTCD